MSHYLLTAMLALAGADAASAREPLPWAKCFTIHASVAPHAGHPTYRVSPPQPSGWLALIERDERGKLIDPLPKNVRKLFPQNEHALQTVVTGDFLICPLGPPRPGNLRLARMVSARNVSVHEDQWLR